MFLEDIELLEAPIDIITSIIPGVGGIVFLKVGITIREVPKTCKQLNSYIN